MTDFITRENLESAIKEAVKVERPVKEEGWFEKWPRPLMRWVMVFLIPYTALDKEVSSEKFMIVAGLAMAFYGIREAGQYFNNKSSRPNYYEPEYRREPFFDDESDSRSRYTDDRP